MNQIQTLEANRPRSLDTIEGTTSILAQLQQRQQLMKMRQEQMQQAQQYQQLQQNQQQNQLNLSNNEKWSGDLEMKNKKPDELSIKSPNTGVGSVRDLASRFEHIKLTVGSKIKHQSNIIRIKFVHIHLKRF